MAESVCIELMNAMLSTTFVRFGKISLTQALLWPWHENVTVPFFPSLQCP